MFEVKYKDRHPSPVTKEEESFIRDELLKAQSLSDSQISSIPLSAVSSLPTLKKQLIYVANKQGIKLCLKKSKDELILGFPKGKKPTHSRITKEQAENLIVQTLNSSADSISRQELAKLSGLNPKRVGSILKDYVNRGVVEKTGTGPQTRFHKG